MACERGACLFAPYEPLLQSIARPRYPNLLTDEPLHRRRGQHLRLRDRDHLDPATAASSATFTENAEGCIRAGVDNFDLWSIDEVKDLQNWGLGV